MLLYGGSLGWNFTSRKCKWKWKLWYLFSLILRLIFKEFFPPTRLWTRSYHFCFNHCSIMPFRSLAVIDQSKDSISHNLCKQCSFVSFVCSVFHFWFTWLPSHFSLHFFISIFRVKLSHIMLVPFYSFFVSTSCHVK